MYLEVALTVQVRQQTSELSSWEYVASEPGQRLLAAFRSGSCCASARRPTADPAAGSSTGGFGVLIVSTSAAQILGQLKQQRITSASCGVYERWVGQDMEQPPARSVGLVPAGRASSTRDDDAGRG
jgi:hypothetical protein